MASTPKLRRRGAGSGLYLTARSVWDYCDFPRAVIGHTASTRSFRMPYI
jgi:hypothetical protein